ncbi:MAG: serine O-acetyltransferase [Nitrospinota bacterium]|nr:serine O-acetyltransferase [Nitrospinota bacterium]
MLGQLKEDVQEAMKKDPAARHFWEVLICYPGVHALLAYRFNHWLWNHNIKLIARWFSYLARWLTGIEIHPAAKIGRKFFIDHGMGVVIGETSEIRDNVFIYHGVTLGGLSTKKGKRHPTICDNVVIGAGAQVLGPVTVGNNSKIGSGSVVVQSVPEYSTVIGVPGRVVFSGISADFEDLEETFPDPMAQAIEAVLDRLPQMEKDIRLLRDSLAKNSTEEKTPPPPQPVPLKKTGMKKASNDN